MPYGPDGWAFVHTDRNRSVIVTCGAVDGVDWVHASMAGAGQVPDYGDLRMLHLAVFGRGWSYQVFAPPAEHVNIHPHALHLFGRLDGRPVLPDFTWGSGSV
jgi:hypothetical protein